MALTHRAPKQWSLSKIETVNSFENWRQNIVYTLATDANFSHFLADNFTWRKRTRNEPFHGFENDGDDIPARQRHTAQQKSNYLDLMLGQIANYCPIISRNTIIKSSTSLNYIWQAIRLHFGFQSTGAHFIDLDEMKLEPDERPEDLYQRLMAFVEDNLLKRDGGITHNGDTIDEDEELTPSLENMIVLQWLRLINKDLPKLVKQRYGTELRSRSLTSIKPEISQALPSLLDEIRSAEDARIMRTTNWNRRQDSTPTGKYQPVRKSTRSCPICKAAGRTSSDHYLSSCKYLPDRDRKYLLKARQIVSIVESPETSDIDEEEVGEPSLDTAPSPSSSTLRVQIRQSPYIDAFYDHHTVRIILDSGATGNMIRLSTAQSLGLNIQKSSQSAHQADGSSPLTVVGETKATFTRGNEEFYFEALVVEHLDVAVLAGIPFMESNDVSIRPAKRQVLLRDGSTVYYGSTGNKSNNHTVRRACILRAPPSTTTTIWPGEYIELSVPPEYAATDDVFSLEPRTDTRPAQSTISATWPSHEILSSVSGKIRIPNNTTFPQQLKKDEHFCQIRPVFIPDRDEDKLPDTSWIPRPPSLQHHDKFSDSVQVDPNDILPPEVRNQLKELLLEYDDVFNPMIECYNGASGPFQAVVNMGPVQPPQRKGRVPQYSRNQLSLLQQMFDDLEEKGVFKRPEDVGVQVEYLNPSFLVKKPSGGHRLVTAFGDVGRYSKPQPSLLPDVDSILRHIGQWKYIITTDLSSAFYQIPLEKSSMKYCGVATPFRGTRVYARSAMGMPGSETALEELMCRVLGDLLEEGVVTKLADDLYCGGETPSDLLHNWKRLLETLQHNNLRLSAHKTIIAPRSVNILGWLWQQGSIQASPHRVATLSTCSPPTTVHGMRSFVGAYKILARVLKGCSQVLSPLENSVAGRQTKDQIVWTNELLAAFQRAQSMLSTNKAIVLPHPDDQLWIVTDGAVKDPGIGATLYVTRDNRPRLAGFFSAKLRPRQITWLPCEIEALSIAAATKHFSPFIIQSRLKTIILTDSKPCVLAFAKLCRGEFSASPRVSTFLSTVSRYQATIHHLSGAANMPSDFASRNAPECRNQSCQICSFIEDIEDSVVRNTSISDIMSGTNRLPFTTRSTWHSIQEECKDLRRTHAHLVQGTRPSKKLTNIRDVKRYLNVVTIAKDGLLVVPRSDPLLPRRECIVVPRLVLQGLLTALHIQLDHPSAFQLKKVVQRYFFALDMDGCIDCVSTTCHQCAALRKTPTVVVEQSSSRPPEHAGVFFASDIMKRERQLILLVRETVTSYTSACLIEDERSETIRNALIRLCIESRPLDGPPAVIRTDPAPGFQSLVNDVLLQRHRLTIEIGRVKNKNKNPVAERAIQELGDELLRQEPTRGPVTPTGLSVAVARLNSRIRNRGVSAREMWFQRDQFTNSQLPLADKQLISDQHSSRLANHPQSEKSKAPKGVLPTSPAIHTGDLVYLHCDRNKSCARNRYLVVQVDGLWCDIRKFVGSQLRNNSYRVKISECYMVPNLTFSNDTFSSNTMSDDDAAVSTDGDSALVSSPLIPPEIVSPLPYETPTPPKCDNPLTSTDSYDVHSDDESRVPPRPKRQRQLPSHLNDFIINY